MRRLLALVLSALLLASWSSLPDAVATTTGQPQVAGPAPLRSFTTSTEARGVSVQPDTGQLLVSGNDGSIRSYPAGSTGAVDGAIVATGLGGPVQGDFDSEGRLYVPEYGSNDVEVLDFVAPSHSLGLVGLLSPRQVSVDAADRVYVTNLANNGEIVVREPQGASSSIRGSGASDLESPAGVAIGPDGSVYVLDRRASGPVVQVFAAYPNSVGTVAAIRTIELPDSVTEPSTLDVDDGGNVYVPDLGGQVVVYAPGASGAAAPRRSLLLTDSGGPVIALNVIAGRRVLLPEFPNGRVSTFAPLVPYAAPGPVRSLSVAGARTARSRTITWRRPASAGDRPVSTYVATVHKGGARGAVVKRRTAPSTRWALSTNRLRAGGYTVVVQARSTIGSGRAATTSFEVRKPARTH